MELGLMVEPQTGGSYEDLLALARWAEDAGLDVFARSDHYMNMDKAAEATDAFATLAGLARDTDRIKLAVLVTPLTFRHPAVIAKTAATIDQMSAGRLELGIGTGWMEPEHEAFGMQLPPLAERFSRLFEVLAYCHAAFGEGASGFQGRHYRLAEIDVQPKPRNLPIIVGGSGKKKTPMMAGRFADEYNMFVTTPDELAPRLAVAHDAARDVDRDPSRLLVSMVTSLFFGETRADYDEQIAKAAKDRDLSPAEFEQRLNDRGVPRGTPDELRERLGVLEAAGVGRLYIQMFSPLASIDTGLLEPAVAAIRA